MRTTQSLRTAILRQFHSFATTGSPRSSLESSHRAQRSVVMAFCATLLFCLLVVGGSMTVTAQQSSGNVNTEARKLAHLLIKNALISVNQGNLTGNYTVLRDLASPGFRERNSASDLGTIFAGLRQQKLDLSPIVLLDPVITHSKFAKEKNQLRLAGYFPSEPLQVKFDLVFQMANPGGWMIHGISIGTEAVEAKLHNEVEETAAKAPAAEPQAQRVKQVSASSDDVEPVAPRPRPATNTAPPPSARIKK